MNWVSVVEIVTELVLPDVAVTAEEKAALGVTD
jgi:hypothetical protein